MTHMPRASEPQAHPDRGDSGAGGAEQLARRIRPAANLLLLGRSDDGEESDSDRQIIGDRNASEQARRRRILGGKQVPRVELDILWNKGARPALRRCGPEAFRLAA